jgi:hypothetical protein
MANIIKSQASIRKTDAEWQIAYAEVYAPDLLDRQKEFMKADEIRKMAYLWMTANQSEAVDHQHNNELTGCIVVESFIARPNDPDFIEGAWVVAIYFPDADMWEEVKTGKINGLSLEAEVGKIPTTVTIDPPTQIDGETMESLGHTHSFSVYFNSATLLPYGLTSITNGHQHQILGPVVTEMEEDHAHRYSLTEITNELTCD